MSYNTTPSLSHFSDKHVIVVISSGIMQDAIGILGIPLKSSSPALLVP